MTLLSVLVVLIAVVFGLAGLMVDHARKMLVPESPAGWADIWPGVGHHPVIAPHRLAAEIEAKRLRLAVLANIANDPPPFAGMAWQFLKIEAHAYASRPGFKDEWRLT